MWASGRHAKPNEMQFRAPVRQTAERSLVILATGRTGDQNSPMAQRIDGRGRTLSHYGQPWVVPRTSVRSD